MNAQGQFAVRAPSSEAKDNIEAAFLAHYERVARIISRVTRDPARAEELAVDVFLKLWRARNVQPDAAASWLYRVAVRTGLNELRAHRRRSRYESLLPWFRRPDPEELCAATEEQESVRLILGLIQPRHAELLLLRSSGLSYSEMASALEINPASIGTLLSRAQQSFRKEYVKRYGE